MSQIILLVGLLFGQPANMFASPIPNKEMTPLLNSIKNSFKELKNAGTDKLNDAIIVDAGLAHNW